MSPESRLLDVDEVDGFIAQVWTGTSGTGNVYGGHYRSRTFETAYLEYGIMQELVKGTDKEVWFYRIRWKITRSMAGKSMQINIKRL